MAAAAGPGGRAAVPVRRGRRRRGRAGAAAAEDEAVLAVAECPVCRQALAEAVTPPCRHSFCLACFQRCLQGPGLCCPLCRSRLSTWARRQQARTEPAATTAAGGGGEQRPPDPDFIFRAPIKLSKPGELREEYESQLRKVPPVTSTSTPLVGVLSSTQNNRCLSAPDLTAEKRLVLNPVSSLSALHKPERSISPESNDSISEELNHFKPIVCSPCTPPKRLPDGRVLSPLIIKSTPRNLNRSLQKPTTYEASPRILKKWEQIFQERQIKKTLSKATLTSLASEPGEDVIVPDITNSSTCTKEQPQAQDDHLPPDTTGDPRPELDFFPSISEAKLGRGSEKNRAAQALTTDDSAAEPDARSNVASLNARVSEVPDLKVSTFMDKSCLSLGPKMLSRRLMGVSASLPDNSTLGVPVKTPGKKQLKYLNNSELINVQNSTCNSVENLIGEQPPSLRRGRKRRCKTKHLEHNGSVKRLRHAAGEVGLPPEDRLVREMEQKLQQEEEDRRLALHLQRIFDSENRTVDRRKVRVDRYLLRSKSTLGAK
ncbi:E3 ubiquitin-protein ligase RNF169 isoform 2-T2 [Theristicus caerulescens]